MTATAHEPRRARRRAARLASPAGLILAFLCLLLPFMSASCSAEEPPRQQWRVTYTGVDVVTGGAPEIAFTDDADKKPITELDDAEARQFLGRAPTPLPPQPLAWPAAALMVAALAATAWPSRTWRLPATAGLALAAAVVLCGATVLARKAATDAVATVLSRVTTPSSTPLPTVPELRAWESYGQVGEMFRYSYGFWLAVVALCAVGLADTVRAVRKPVSEEER